MIAIKLVDTTRDRAGQKTTVPPAIIFLGAVGCFAFCWLGLQVAGPLQQAARLHSENDQLERQVRLKDMQNQEAKKRAQAIETDQGKIVAARTKGYMFANEHPLHIQSDGTPDQK